LPASQIGLRPGIETYWDRGQPRFDPDFLETPEFYCPVSDADRAKRRMGGALKRHHYFGISGDGGRFLGSTACVIAF
jgi:hypothetical protein